MEEISKLDTRLMLWINRHHTAWLDPVMLLLTKTWIWIPLYVFFLFLLWRSYKKETFFILTGVAVAVTLADGITTGIMKPYFARLRPSHEPAIRELIHTVGGYSGGQFGFASSHAANVFAVALLLWLVLKKHYRWSWLIFIWAAFISYTRVYLGVHYPGDIAAGAVVGLACAVVGYLVYGWAWVYWENKQIKT